MAPSVFAFLTFAATVYLDHTPLTPSRVFTVLTLFHIVQMDLTKVMRRMCKNL